MDVGCTTTVMTWEYGLELCDTIGIGRLQAAQESRINIRSIILVSVARTDNSTVDTSGVAMSDIPTKTRNRITSVDVDGLAINDDVHAFLVLTNVLADIFASHVCIRS